jgi:hypothetical protein
MLRRPSFVNTFTILVLNVPTRGFGEPAAAGRCCPSRGGQTGGTLFLELDRDGEGKSW